jgi:glycosyltransferase involved in cell wall biosynthesis
MHILIVNGTPIPALRYGGTERVIWDLGKALVAAGHRVSYLVPAGSSCPFAPVLPLQPDVAWNAQIPADVDVVHFQFHPKQTIDKPCLMTEHGNARKRKPLPLNTVFVSHNHAQRHGSAHCVLNGLDWAAYGEVDFAQPRKHVHFLGKGAWSVKNLRGAIQVALQAGMELDVLGADRFQFKRGIRLTLSRRIHFHGMVGGAEKNRLLNGSRAMVFPVRWHEPFGLAIIESLYFGCPVFATPYGAIPEIVSSEFGYLATSASELARALTSIDRFDPRACHQHARTNFSAQRMAQDYVRYYERILEGETLHTEPVHILEPGRDLPWTR